MKANMGFKPKSSGSFKQRGVTQVFGQPAPNYNSKTDNEQGFSFILLVRRQFCLISATLLYHIKILPSNQCLKQYQYWCNYIQEYVCIFLKFIYLCFVKYERSMNIFCIFLCNISSTLSTTVRPRYLEIRYLEGTDISNLFSGPDRLSIQMRINLAVYSNSR